MDYPYPPVAKRMVLLFDGREIVDGCEIVVPASTIGWEGHPLVFVPRYMHQKSGESEEVVSCRVGVTVSRRFSHAWKLRRTDSELWVRKQLLDTGMIRSDSQTFCGWCDLRFAPTEPRRIGFELIVDPNTPIVPGDRESITIALICLDGVAEWTVNLCFAESEPSDE